MITILKIFRIFAKKINRKTKEMQTATINITLNSDFINQIDIIANKTSQTRNEIIYNSIKFYIDQKQKLEELYQYGEEFAAKNNIKEEDIVNEIANYRK